MKAQEARNDGSGKAGAAGKHGDRTGNAAPGTQPRDLPPAARRALAEAEERRKAEKEAADTPEKEIGGRGGADPVRYGDWEIKGRAIDF